MIRFSAILFLTGFLLVPFVGQTVYSQTYDTITVNGIQRSFIVYQSPTVPAQRPPVVIGLHGSSQSAEFYANASRLAQLAPAAGYIAVVPRGYALPNGTLNTWKAGTCCYPATTQSGANWDDVAFISQLIDAVVEKYGGDSTRIFCTGFSNGAMMSYRVACELSHKIRAIAPFAGGLEVTAPCVTSRPVSVFHIHSKLDKVVPYEGGTSSASAQLYFRSVDSALTVFQTQNGCVGSANEVYEQGVTKYDWTNCESESRIRYWLTDVGGHELPAQNNPFQVTPAVIEFFNLVGGLPTSVGESTLADNFDAIAIRGRHLFVPACEKETAVTVFSITGAVLWSGLALPAGIALPEQQFPNGVYIVQSKCESLALPITKLVFIW